MAVSRDKIRQYEESPSMFSKIGNLFGRDSTSNTPMINPNESASLLKSKSPKDEFDNEVQKAGFNYLTRTVTEKVSGAFSSASGAVSGAVETGRNLKYAVGFFAMGAMFLFFSSMFLPMIVLSPQKFALMFTMGSTCIIMGFAFLTGPASYAKYLMTKEKLPFSASYLGSMAFTVYAALVWQSYLMVLLFCGIQIFAMLWFTCSSVPGGVNAMTQCSSFAWSMTLGKFLKRSSLPF